MLNYTVKWLRLHFDLEFWIESQVSEIATFIAANIFPIILCVCILTWSIEVIFKVYWGYFWQNQLEIFRTKSTQDNMAIRENNWMYWNLNRMFNLNKSSFIIMNLNFRILWRLVLGRQQINGDFHVNYNQRFIWIILRLRYWMKKIPIRILNGIW